MILSVLALMPLAAAPAGAEADYAHRAGKPVGVYENEELNYRLNLEGHSYTFINFTEQVPEASFAAMRFTPNVVSVVIVEDIGVTFSTEQYAELVRTAMTSRLDGSDEVELKDFPNVERWYNALMARPATKRGMEAKLD